METVKFGAVTVDRQDRRALVSWDLPPLNVMTIASLHELAGALASPAVQGASCVVLRGAGRAWSAGLSVQEHLQPKARAMLDAFGAALRAVEAVPVPTIAQVHGACLGGGLELLSRCDLAVAGASASFGQPEIKLGVFPPVAVAFYARLYGAQRANALVYLGEAVDAAEALRWGLVHKVVPDAELAKAVELVASQVERHPRRVLALTKRAMREADPTPWDRLVAAERTYLDALMAAPDAEEGLRAFIEKRAPRWKEG